MDWFHNAQRNNPSDPPALITDLIDGESFQKLVRPEDRVEKLHILDGFLCRSQSRAGNAWRNTVKLLVLPFQILRLRRILRRYGNAIIDAHSMYYIVLARFSGRSYVATPQGSELLVRPHRSFLYRHFAKLGLSGASAIVVDSVAMRRSLAEVFGLKAHIIQNGIDVEAIAALQKGSSAGNTASPRSTVVSLRGMSPNYQIDRLVDARNDSAKDTPLYFSYPFEEAEYKRLVSAKLTALDRDFGRLSRADYYDLLFTARLVISIPKSDSSPRSVYEAIFCGCFVAVTPAEWIKLLPACMAARVIVVDLSSRTWLPDALEFAAANVHKPYVPSAEALELFDQKRSSLRYYREIYPIARQRMGAGAQGEQHALAGSPLQASAEEGSRFPSEPTQRHAA